MGEKINPWTLLKCQSQLQQTQSWIFFHCFSEKIRLDILCESSDLHETSKVKKKVLSAAILLGSLRVRYHSTKILQKVQTHQSVQIIKRSQTRKTWRKLMLSKALLLVFIDTKIITFLIQLLQRCDCDWNSHTLSYLKFFFFFWYHLEVGTASNLENRQAFFLMSWSWCFSHNPANMNICNEIWRFLQYSVLLCIEIVSLLTSSSITQLIFEKWTMKTESLFSENQTTCIIQNRRE